MPTRPIVFVHGYSASERSFAKWREILEAKGYEATSIHVSTYQSLTNEVTIRDLAEAFDRALRVKAGLDQDEPFSAVVHSTGMLVVRAWLSAYRQRRGRLKNLVGLAPATFGSPLAHKGRSWLGALVRGNKEVGPDFLEAGNLILGGLELGSRLTWDLAHQDLLGDEAVYGPSGDTPYVFVFCGTQGYGGLLKLANTPGSDGTVRLAGCPLNTRKLVIDLTEDAARSGAAPRVQAAPWSNVDIPLVPVAGLDHGTILSRPSDDLVTLVDAALNVADADAYARWQAAADAHREQVFAHDPHLGRWQQFVMRVVDERGDPVPDYFVEFIIRQAGTAHWQPLKDVHGAFTPDVHPYGADKSLRCLHVDLASVPLAPGDRLGVRLIASSGSQLVGYHGYSDDLEVKDAGETLGEWSGVIDLSSLTDVTLFYPFTTTLLEIRLNREPLPLSGDNKLLWFPDAPASRRVRRAAELAAKIAQSDKDEARLNTLMEEFEARLGETGR